MKITANNPNRKSWIEVVKISNFPFKTILFGLFLQGVELPPKGFDVDDDLMKIGKKSVMVNNGRLGWSLAISPRATMLPSAWQK